MRRGIVRRGARLFALVATLLAAGCERPPEDRGREAEIAHRVESEIRRRGVDGVEVTVEQHTLVLSGMVPTEDQRAAAERVARDASGMHLVHNRLSVARPPELTNAPAP